MNRVMDELPAYYRHIREFQEYAKTQSKQLELLEKAILQLEDDQFIITSSEPAIYRREKEFGIIPDPRLETLEFRKKRLLNRMMRKAPFTYRYLIQQLNELVGIGKYVVSIDVANYWIKVLVWAESYSYYKEATEFLERTVPLNLLLETGILVDRVNVVVSVKNYTFSVPYPVTGTFHTAPINGVASKATVEVESKIYANSVPYPVTGTFYCSEGGY